MRSQSNRKCEVCAKPILARNQCSVCQRTRKCRREYRRRLYAANPENRLAVMRRYRAAHPERIRAAARKRYNADPESVLAKNRRYYAANLKRVRAACRKRARRHYAAHREEILATARKHYAERK